jgi:hypothetical protein
MARRARERGRKKAETKTKEKRGDLGAAARGRREKLGFLGIKKGKERAHVLGVLDGGPCREKRRSVGEDNKEHSR